MTLVDPLLTPSAAPAAAPAPAQRARAATGGAGFGQVLASRTSGLQFSGHALQRVERRGIDLSPQTLQRLQTGVDRAMGKGARESVVLVDDTAFVVSVRTKTVITAVDHAHMRDHVFTNIDSAVIA